MSAAEAEVTQLRRGCDPLIPLQELLLLPQQPLTSGCFLRDLRSLTILAFLAGFLSSRSLSPSPLEDVAEALLSNLHGDRASELSPDTTALSWSCRAPVTGPQGSGLPGTRLIVFCFPDIWNSHGTRAQL